MAFVELCPSCERVAWWGLEALARLTARAKAALARDLGASVASIAELGIDTKRPPGQGASSAGGTKQFIHALETTIDEAYQRSLRMAESEIRVLVEKKARNYWDVEVVRACVRIGVVR